MCVVQTFAFYGVSPSEVVQTNNKYFISPATDRYESDRSGDIYTKSDQEHILRVVQSAYFFTIIITQAIHIWTIRHSTHSVFSPQLLENRRTVLGVAVAVSVGLVAVYTPGVQTFVSSYNPPSLVLLQGAGLACVAIVGWTELRKHVLRAHPSSWLACKFRM
jgi:magnesium-transporting ATPase (P-type)